MSDGLNVLSLFDGMSCGRVALERAGIAVNQYFASEIDRFAMQISRKNYPDIVQMGDVKHVHDLALPSIDLLLGGSPCQGFSFAGKQLAFDDPRSALFFEFVRLLKEVKPRYFLLENVRMKKEHQAVITEALGVEPTNINSNLVSAQNRNRFYWTNIPNVTQPEDKGLFLKDILEPDFEPGGPYDITDRVKAKRKGTLAYEKAHGNARTPFQKCSALLASAQSISNSGATNVLMPVIKSHGRLVSKPNKSQCLDANYAKGPDNHGQRTFLSSGATWRKLTPIECERLQTLPDNYTDGVSNTQRYKMIGNGWTIDVIVHILKNLVDKEISKCQP